VTYKPPTGLRALIIIMKASLRRRVNRTHKRLRFAFGEKRQEKASSTRTATPSKSHRNLVFSILLALLFIFNATAIWSMLLYRLSDRIDGQQIGGKADHPDELPQNGIPESKDEMEYRPWPSAELWPEGERRGQMINVIGLVLLLLFLAVLFTDLGMRNVDLSKTEWDLEWLFTFPVSAKAVFAEKVIEYAIASLFIWWLMLPFLCVVLWSGGFAWWGLVIGSAVTVHIALTLGALRLLCEVWLKKRLSKGAIKNLQASFTVLGLACFLSAWSAAFQPRMLDILLDLSCHMPESIMWLPWLAPILLCDTGISALGPVLMIALGGGTIIAGTVVASGDIVKDGLIKAGGAYAGTRGDTAKPRTLLLPFKGVIGKDVRLLIRDRNLLIAITVVPGMVIAYQLVINPFLLKSAFVDFRYAAALAFGIGAFVLVSGTSAILAVEGKSLWLFFTFPKSMRRIISSKANLWGIIALSITAIVLIAALLRNPDLWLDALWRGTLAILGVLMYSRIAAGLSVLYTDPFESEMQQRLRPELSMLFMLLAGMYVGAIFAPSGYYSAMAVAMSALLAYAIWQRAMERIPFILDPIENPPNHIGLIDGLVTAYLFFTIQGLLLLAFHSRDVTPRPKDLVVIYSFSAAAVTIISLYFFWRLKAHGFLETIGLKRSGKAHATWVKALTTGLFWGLLAAVIGVLYLNLIDLFEPLRELKQQSLDILARTNHKDWWWVGILLLIAAPLLEEYIFRGLVFKGMRRSSRPAIAVLGSAAIFAMVHPPISALPVFALGIATAVSFQRSGLLIAPIATHVTYNAAVLAAQLANAA